MESTKRVNDEELEAVLEQFLAGQRIKPGDKRRAPRSSYLAPLSIAPFDGDRFPEADDFVPVHARDISTNGISFFTVEMPASEMVVLQLGNSRDSLIYVGARIVRVSSGYFRRRRQLLVCCQFVSRLLPKQR